MTWASLAFPLVTVIAMIEDNTSGCGACTPGCSMYRGRQRDCKCQFSCLHLELPRLVLILVVFSHFLVVMSIRFYCGTQTNAHEGYMPGCSVQKILVWCS